MSLFLDECRVRFMPRCVVQWSASIWQTVRRSTRLLQVRDVDEHAVRVCTECSFARLPIWLYYFTAAALCTVSRVSKHRFWTFNEFSAHTLQAVGVPSFAAFLVCDGCVATFMALMRCVILRIHLKQSDGLIILFYLPRYLLFLVLKGGTQLFLS